MKMLPTLAAGLLLATAYPATAGHHEAGHHQASTIVETAMASSQHQTLVAAVKAADLAGALSGSGPFTVFAPTDQAFDGLPEGTVQTLLEPGNKAKLQAVLTYHVVSGRVSAADLVGLIGKNGGSAELTTLQGGVLTARLDGDSVILTDENGGMATVVAADLAASNGLIHVTDAVSLPG
ncbi:MAG: fasciclin domain-containing protein [Novosphingobium sp.]|nr:fasciclin domain-containing protein [Novosphingobium sp.]MCP5401175.1 fasciclin domain-containing protein [Novosphingobium sp.]